MANCLSILIIKKKKKKKIEEYLHTTYFWLDSKILKQKLESFFRRVYYLCYVYETNLSENDRFVESFVSKCFFSNVSRNQILECTFTSSNFSTYYAAVQACYLFVR